jgi:microcystin-dependent protein
MEDTSSVGTPFLPVTDFDVQSSIKNDLDDVMFHVDKAEQIVKKSKIYLVIQVLMVVIPVAGVAILWIILEHNIKGMNREVKMLKEYNLEITKNIGINQNEIKELNQKLDVERMKFELLSGEVNMFNSTLQRLQNTLSEMYQSVEKQQTSLSTAMLVLEQQSYFISYQSWVVDILNKSVLMTSAEMHIIENATRLLNESIFLSNEKLNALTREFEEGIKIPMEFIANAVNETRELAEAAQQTFNDFELLSNWTVSEINLLNTYISQYNISNFATIQQLNEISEEMVKILPIGTVIPYPSHTLPSGFLECNGETVNRDQYGELFDIIGTIYGSGDNSTGDNNTTFNLPDYRGMFLRGWSHGSNIDVDSLSRSDRGDGVNGDYVGTFQSDAMQSHKHDDIGHSHIVGNMFQTTVIPLNSVNAIFFNGGGNLPSVNGHASLTDPTESTAGPVRLSQETRPKNKNVMYIIKVQ